MANADCSPAALPDWLLGDPVAEHLRAQGRAVTKAAWLEEAYGSSSASQACFARADLESVIKGVSRGPAMTSKAWPAMTLPGTSTAR